MCISIYDMYEEIISTNCETSHLRRSTCSKGTGGTSLLDFQSYTRMIIQGTGKLGLVVMIKGNLSQVYVYWIALDSPQAGHQSAHYCYLKIDHPVSA